jgi:hypothetical protein
MQFTRFLRNRSVTAGEMAIHAAEGTAMRVAGRDVIVIQDTTELVLGGRRARTNGYGPVGKGWDWRWRRAARRHSPGLCYTRGLLPFPSASTGFKE